MSGRKLVAVALALMGAAAGLAAIGPCRIADRGPSDPASRIGDDGRAADQSQPRHWSEEDRLIVRLVLAKSDFDGAEPVRADVFVRNPTGRAEPLDDGESVRPLTVPKPRLRGSGRRRDVHGAGPPARAAAFRASCPGPGARPTGRVSPGPSTDPGGQDRTRRG
jgi:hypothetical protein